jgi:hypothetical protein
VVALLVLFDVLFFCGIYGYGYKRTTEYENSVVVYLGEEKVVEEKNYRGPENVEFHLYPLRLIPDPY